MKFIHQVVHSFSRIFRQNDNAREKAVPSAAQNLHQGMVLERQGRMDEALKHYETATQLQPGFAHAHFNKANILLDQGNASAALEAYERALKHKPGSASTLFNMGAAWSQLGQLENALAAYLEASNANPEFADAEIALCHVLGELGRLEESSERFKRALTLNPKCLNPFYQQGLQLLNQKLFAQSIASFHKALKIQPNSDSAFLQLGNATSELNELETALAFYTQSLDLNPKNNEAVFNKGLAFLKLKRFEAASECFQQLLEVEPNSAEAYNNLGLINKQQLHTEAAVQFFKKAILLKPNFAEAHSNLAHTYQTLGKVEDAKKCYLNSLNINYDLAQTHCSFGTLFHSLNQPDEAERHFRYAIKLQPSLYDAHNNLGVILDSTRRFEEAIICFKKALEIKPDFASAFINLANVLKNIGQIDQALAHLEHAIKLDPAALHAYSNWLFIHSYLEDQAADLMLAKAKEFGTLTHQIAMPFKAWQVQRDSRKSLRVGFISGDLCAHPVGYFLEGVLSSLSDAASAQLELYAYPTTFCDDALSHRIKASFTSWCPAAGMSDEALAKQIHNDKIDILIDLSGHSAHNRLPVFAWKPSPILVSWLGYFATTGVTAIDYLLADPWTLPLNEEVYFTEKVWRLPETRLCFTAPDEQVLVSSLPAIENGYVTFGCFNNLAKMSDAVVALWARILKAMPTGRLFLKSIQITDSLLCQSIFDRFAVHGIDANRLILEAYGPRSDYLAAYRRVDIALDPFPYPGGTTTVEALWMGVPVLTLRGERFLSRQGVGLMMNAGLPDWVATDPEDYLGKALLHANDLQALANLRISLRQQVLTSPIFDAPRFAQHLLAALRAMWTQWCAQPSDEVIQPQKVPDGTV